MKPGTTAAAEKLPILLPAVSGQELLLLPDRTVPCCSAAACASAGKQYAAADQTAYEIQLPVITKETANTSSLFSLSETEKEDSRITSGNRQRQIPAGKERNLQTRHRIYLEGSCSDTRQCLLQNRNRSFFADGCGCFRSAARSSDTIHPSENKRRAASDMRKSQTGKIPARNGFLRNRDHRTVLRHQIPAVFPYRPVLLYCCSV